MKLLCCGRRMSCTDSRESVNGLWRRRYKCHECGNAVGTREMTAAKYDEITGPVTMAARREEVKTLLSAALAKLDGPPALGSPGLE